MGLLLCRHTFPWWAQRGPNHSTSERLREGQESQRDLATWLDLKGQEGEGWALQVEGRRKGDRHKAKGAAKQRACPGPQSTVLRMIPWSPSSLQGFP